MSQRRKSLSPGGSPNELYQQTCHLVAPLSVCVRVSGCVREGMLQSIVNLNTHYANDLSSTLFQIVISAFKILSMYFINWKFSFK